MWRSVRIAEADSRTLTGDCAPLAACDLLLTVITMMRKALTTLSLLGLVLSVGLWGVSSWGIGFRSLLYSRDQLIENNHAHITELDGILCRDRNPTLETQTATPLWGPCTMS